MCKERMPRHSRPSWLQKQATIRCPMEEQGTAQATGRGSYTDPQPRVPAEAAAFLLDPSSLPPSWLGIWEPGKVCWWSTGIPGISPGGMAGDTGESPGMWCQSVLFWERSQS